MPFSTGFFPFVGVCSQYGQYVINAGIFEKKIFKKVIRNLRPIFQTLKANRTLFTSAREPQ